MIRWQIKPWLDANVVQSSLVSNARRDQTGALPPRVGRPFNKHTILRRLPLNADFRRKRRTARGSEPR